MENLEEAAREIVQLLEKHQVPYVIIGGLAVRIHALPRPTWDIDFTIGVDRDELPPLLADAESRGFEVPEPYQKGWVDSVKQLPLIKVRWPTHDRAIDVDIFLAETPFQQSVLKRRQRHASLDFGWDAWFSTAEDVLLLKLLADRPRDRLDVADVLLVQGALDTNYLRTWGDRLGIREQVDQALRQQAEMH